MKKKKLVTMLLILGMFSNLAACGSGSSPEAPPSATSAAESVFPETVSPEAAAAYQDTLHIAVTQQAPSLDLHKNSSLIARQIMDGSVFEKLVTLDKNGEAVPELCESFSLNDDAKELTFTLRPDVKFHDGSIMTADDVVTSMNRWIEGFSTAKTMLGDARFEKVDDTTVKISSDSSLLLLPEMIAGSAQPAAITTAAACESEDENGFLKDYIGTGPYVFTEWVQDQYIKLDRFDNYTSYGDETKPLDGTAGYKAALTKTLEYDIVPDQSTSTAGLESGQYDLCFNITSDDLPRLESNPSLSVTSSQQGQVALVFNHKQGLGAEQYFRTAVNTALDCDEILTAAYGAGYELGSCYMDAGQDAWLTDVGSESYNIKDPDKAKQILTAGGYSGEKFTILAATLNHMDQMAVAMKSELEAIGINVELSIVDWATLTDYRKDPGKFDLYITSFATVPTPSLKLYYGKEYPGWSDDPKLTELFDVMTGAVTKEDAQAAWVELQKYSWDYLPIICPGHYLGNYAWKKELTGVEMVGTGPKFWNAGIPIT